MPNVRVVLAERNRLVRDVIARACQRHGLQVVAEVSTVDQLLGLPADLDPAVVVLSEPLAGTPVDAAVGELVRRGTGVLILSDEPSPDRILTLLAAGASSWLMHDMPADRVAEAIWRITTGGSTLHPRVAAIVLAEWRQLRAAETREFSLTPREIEVLIGITEGLPTKAIARRLGIALKTVESHKFRLFDKLGAKNQAHAVSIAMGHGLVPPVTMDSLAITGSASY